MRNNIIKLKPTNGSHFTLREAFVIMKEEGITSHNFFLQATDPKVHRNKIKLHCHRSTFIRRYKKFTKDGILPKVDDYGSNVGAPQIVIKKDVPLLNNSVHNSVGLSENNAALCDTLVLVNETNKEKHGDYAYLSNPCPSIVQLYQLLAVAEDDDIHLVRDRKMKVKDKRRQMASTSVRNLASHIAAVAYSNFIPVAEKWVTPKGLPSKFCASPPLEQQLKRKSNTQSTKKKVVRRTKKVKHSPSSRIVSAYYFSNK